MIFVTVGMHRDGFHRLIQEMDEIAATSDEEVLMQIGATEYHPRTAQWFRFAKQEEMKAFIDQARVIVSHAGAGTILMSMHARKPLIVMPRLQKHGEHDDDHQLQLAEALSQAGALLVAYEAADLRKQLSAVDSFTPRFPDGNRDRLVATLREAVLVPRR